MSNETLLGRYEKLTPQSQDELLAYWNKLPRRDEPGSDEGVFRITAEYKRTIAQIPVWTEEDLQPFKDAEAGWQWDTPEW